MDTVQQYANRVVEVKFLLDELKRILEHAEVEADETTWEDEKAEALKEALTRVGVRCSLLEAGLRWVRGDQTVLSKKERDRLAHLLSD